MVQQKFIKLKTTIFSPIDKFLRWGFLGILVNLLINSYDYISLLQDIWFIDFINSQTALICRKEQNSSKGEVTDLIFPWASFLLCWYRGTTTWFSQTRGNSSWIIFSCSHLLWDRVHKSIWVVVFLSDPLVTACSFYSSKGDNQFIFIIPYTFLSYILALFDNIFSFCFLWKCNNRLECHNKNCEIRIKYCCNQQIYNNCIM